MQRKEWTMDRMQELAKNYEGFINEGGTLEKLSIKGIELTQIEVELFNEVLRSLREDEDLE
jgi:hypothetical protein